MPSYGKTSRNRLNSCNYHIQEVYEEAINRLPHTDHMTKITIYDIGIIEGHRGEERQNYLESIGKSQACWPDSKHNKFPSDAIDGGAYHLELPGKYDWGNKNEHEAFARFIIGIAEEKGYHFRSGVDWDEDGVRVDKDPNETFFDGPHIEEVL